MAAHGSAGGAGACAFAYGAGALHALGAGSEQVVGLGAGDEAGAAAAALGRELVNSNVGNVIETLRLEDGRVSTIGVVPTSRHRVVDLLGKCLHVEGV